MREVSIANEPTQAIVPRHKYSIAQLINLSRHVSTPYDLSKFSFDAVRGKRYVLLYISTPVKHYVYLLKNA